ncbi:MAG: DUF3592 domain-containing protein [Pseudomonadota bacterium]
MSDTFFVGLAFLIPGLAIGYIFTLKPFLDHRRSRYWLSVDAELLTVKLQSKKDRDGFFTHQTIARYRYEWDSQAYESERVWFDSGPISSSQQNTYYLLRTYYENNKPFPAHINPNKPSESVLLRDMRWGMMLAALPFFLILSGIGAGMMF